MMMKISYECLDLECVEADEMCSIESSSVRMNYKNQCYGPFHLGLQSNTLIMVFDFCKKRAQIRIQHMYDDDQNLAEHKLNDFDSKFLKQNQSQEDITLLFDLIDAALKLHVKNLFKLVFDVVANICSEMTSKEIGEIFDTDRDYYHEEIRNFDWAFKLNDPHKKNLIKNRSLTATIPVTRQSSSSSNPHIHQTFFRSGVENPSVFERDYDHLKIQLKDVLSATNNFDSANLIGRGGFGQVYIGKLSLLDRSIMVAFKRLDRTLGQGHIEFWNEVKNLSKYKHLNLASLLHYCIEGDEMILGYEYASRGSLDRYLSDASLTWTHRLKICVGAARGLNYLHQERVIHRDIKSGNILLDENWMPKLSDFGLSKADPTNHAQTFLFSNVVGTPGYCDPLYLEMGLLSRESDVYSFGVVLFEILCGRLCFKYNNKDEPTKFFVSKCRWCYEKKTLDEIIFPGLKEQMDPGSLNAFSAVAYQCVKEAREERPTMAKVVEELEFALQQQVISCRDISVGGRQYFTNLSNSSVSVNTGQNRFTSVDMGQNRSMSVPNLLTIQDNSCRSHVSGDSKFLSWI